MRFPAITLFLLSFFACDPATPPNVPTDPKMSSADGGSGPSSTSTGSSTDGGSAPHAKGKTLFIKEAYADCEGEGPMKCLQVREKESDPWTLHYSGIDGFKYEEGYKYEIVVSTATNPNPPQDAPSRRYHLVEIVSKQKVK
jgi:hypothetical protein